MAICAVVRTHVNRRIDVLRDIRNRRIPGSYAAMTLVAIVIRRMCTQRRIAVTLGAVVGCYTGKISRVYPRRRARAVTISRAGTIGIIETRIHCRRAVHVSCSIDTPRNRMTRITRDVACQIARRCKVSNVSADFGIRRIGAARGCLERTKRCGGC